ncbi:MAG: peptide-methionine (R)-S-oxide reductase MsrB, partial [Pseudomonadota bacterium]
LKAKLTPEQYRVTQEHGTECAFTGPYLKEKRPGEYHCVVCDAPLFTSESKFDSGTGWPSFFQPSNNNALKLVKDTTLARERTEIRCANCDAHLGHVFPDGPPPTGMRYCLNGTALNFKPTA